MKNLCNIALLAVAGMAFATVAPAQAKSAAAPAKSAPAKSAKAAKPPVVTKAPAGAESMDARKNRILENLKLKESGANLEEVKLKALEREAGVRFLLSHPPGRSADW